MNDRSQESTVASSVCGPSDDDVTRQATERAAEARLLAASSTPSDPIIKFFGYVHLPEKLLAASQPFHDLAQRIVTTLPRSAERTVALRKLLESKDAAVRAALD